MADVIVARQVWDPLSDDEKARITDVLRHSGALPAGDRIVSGDNQPFLRPNFHIPNPLCKLACNAGEAAAIAACASLSGPAAAACIVAAHTAADYCRSRC
jgi:hypothetical protein